MNDTQEISFFDMPILDTMYDLRTAWKRVTEQTIQNCCDHCGFTTTEDPSPNPYEKGDIDVDNLFE